MGWFRAPCSEIASPPSSKSLIPLRSNFAYFAVSFVVKGLAPPSPFLAFRTGKISSGRGRGNF